MTLRNYQYFGEHTIVANRNSVKQHETARREYPEVDVTMFNESAIAFKQLMKDASIVLNKLADSKDFAKEVMAAAQKSDTTKVDDLIQSTGIKSTVDTSYNPDGITMKFFAKVKDTDCCHLMMNLRWR